jgi:nucleoside-diphosphate-sugar epimerase
LGKAWHVPNAETLTHRAFVERVYRLAGSEPKLRVVPRALVSIMALFNPMLREVKEMLYQLEEDFVVDSSRFTSTFGTRATPLDAAIRPTLDWYRAQSTRSG